MKCRAIRYLQDFLSFCVFAKKKSEKELALSVYQHNSLIRRKLGNTDMQLQENKAINLSIAVPKVNGILLKPGETFSFWHLVGKVSVGAGYREGLTIAKGGASKGIGGGLCQFTNLIHWMILHTPLTITERHHHEQIDLFPDFNRQIPFGTGTSIVYNYLDYRVKNTTDITYQILVYTTDQYLCGEIRADKKQPYVYHVKAENEAFSEETDGFYRNGDIYREVIDPVTGNCIEKRLIQRNHAKVAYDTSELMAVSARLPHPSVRFADSSPQGEPFRG